MFTSHTLLLFMLASLTLSLLPGPDMLYIMTRTLSYDKRAGLLSVAGVSTSLIVHTFAAASGLSLIILQSAHAFMVVKLIGASYLIFLGVKMLLNKNSDQIKLVGEPHLNAAKIYKQGFLTNLFNPKVIVFFMAFLPQFINIHQQHVFYQFIFLGFLLIFIGSIINTIVVFMCHKLKMYIDANQLYKKIQEKISGLILIGIGATLARFKLH